MINNCRIICFNADGNATEILKNLVLAGTGYVVIVDNAKIKEEDLKENFFVNITDIGKNRAEVVLKNLLELNPDDVKGEYHNISCEEYLEKNILQLQTFDISIVSNKQDVNY